jgi:hypothetical protein
MFVALPNFQAGVYEVSPPYNGGPAHAAVAGVRRLQDLDNGQVIHWHPYSNSVVQPGWLFVRKVTRLDPGTGQPNAFDPYVPAGDPNNLPSSFQGFLEVEFPS